MARLRICGAELGNSVELDVLVGSVSFDAAVKRSGAYSLKIVSNPFDTLISYFKLSFDAVATAYFTIHVRFNALPSSGQQGFFYVRSVATPTCLAIDSDGHLNLYNQGGSLRASGTTPLSTATDYRLDLKIGKGAAGACPYELRINGVLEYSGSNGTFGTSDIASCQGGVYKDMGGASVSLTAWYDDMVVRDDAFEAPGIVRVLGMIPNGNGDNSDKVWTGYPANTYEDIDDGLAPDGDASYWHSTANGGKRCATLPSCGDVGVPESAEILSVQTWSFSKLVSGVETLVGHVLRSGGYNFSQDYVELPASYTWTFSLWDTDPATEESWTRAAIDAAQVGVGISQLGLGNEARCTCMGLFLLVREIVYGAASATGSGTATADASTTALGAADATGRGGAIAAAAVVAFGSSSVTGRGTAQIVTTVIVAGAGIATGQGSADLAALVVATAVLAATGRGTAFCVALVVEPGASATSTGRGFAWCCLTEVHFDPLARHFGTRAVPTASAGVRSVSRVHHASRVCVPEDERVCGPRRLS